MLSMTGYGEAVAAEGALRIVVTLRGVNHRFLDVSLRLPEICRSSEPELHRLIGAAAERGRFELTAEISSQETASSVNVNTALASDFSAAAASLAAAGLATGELGVADLMAMPGVIESQALAVPWDEGAAALLLQVGAEALAQLMVARRSEGDRLAEVLAEKFDALGVHLARLQELRPVVQNTLAGLQKERLDKLLETCDIDPQRLAIEAAILLDKTNISEELERLEIHLAHLRDISSQQGAIGKRLDFLVQEVFRELNTLATKCRNLEMTQACVDAKVLCEEVREQLRNVE